MKIMVMAGGTGGHVYPALAVAQALEGLGHQVCWLGSKGGMETRIVDQYGFAIVHIAVKGLRGNGLKGWAVAPIKLVQAVWQAKKHMQAQKPRAVLGMGGFVTGPGGVAARWLGIPLVIHEQNAVAGLTNTLLKPIAAQVLQAFPHTFSGKKVQTVGNPVRDEIAAVPAKTDVSLPLQILVMGGSLGAQALNDVLPEALGQLKTEVVVRHQTGKDKLKTTQQAYQQASIDPQSYQLQEFIEDMAEAFRWADVVVCRAGAMTVFEIAAAGKPALFVPYPHAVDDHQSANAAYLVAQGAAEVVPQAQLNAHYIKEKIESWAADMPSLVEKGKQAKAAYVEKATEAVANVCIEVAA